MRLPNPGLDEMNHICCRLHVRVLCVGARLVLFFPRPGTRRPRFWVFFPGILVLVVAFALMSVGNEGEVFSFYRFDLIFLLSFLFFMTAIQVMDLEMVHQLVQQSERERDRGERSLLKIDGQLFTLQYGRTVTVIERRVRDSLLVFRAIL